MNFNYLMNSDLDKILIDYINLLIKNGMKIKSETIAVKESIGRITSEAVYAKINAPHYNSSAMDGIALMAYKTYGATETTPVKIKKDDYVVVDTGDPLPNGCDAVVMIEDVIFEEDNVVLNSSVTSWQNVRQIGEDICCGEMIIPSYTIISPTHIGAMLASGVLNVKVNAKVIVGIIPTGDEIVTAKENPKKGEIIEFNSAIFSGMLKQWLAVPKVYPIIKDEKNLIEKQIKIALKECDIIIINAGSSAGRDDYTSTIIDNIGHVFKHGISIKPGKPTILGYFKEKAIIGVPGYPVSGIIVLEKIVKPIIKYLTANKIKSKENIEAITVRKINSSLKYREFVRVILGYINNKLIAMPLNQGAGVVSSFIKADGIIDISQNKEGYDIGEKVNVNLLRPLEEIKNTVLFIGSHDPIIDQISDIVSKSNENFRITSFHVGSMGAIRAIKNKEAHIGGIHLLDEENHNYNIGYIKKYFNTDEVVLLSCVRRLQGLIVQKNNPKGIHKIEDLINKDITYINRQRGAGTRILLDYLLKKQQIDKKLIRGYNHEVFTHTSVAINVKEGNADVGLGIYSVAKAYELSFIPLYEEQYDILVSKSALELDMMKKLIDVIKGKEFKKRVEKIGGYVLNNPGEVIHIE